MRTDRNAIWHRWRAAASSPARRRWLSSTLSTYGYGLIFLPVVQSIVRCRQSETGLMLFELLGAVVLLGVAFWAVPASPD